MKSEFSGIDKFTVELPFVVSRDLIRDSKKKITGMRIGIFGCGLNLQGIEVHGLPTMDTITRAIKKLEAEGNLTKAHQFLPGIIKGLMNK